MNNKTKKMNLIVVVAECDECSGCFCIDNAIAFDNSLDAAQFIAEDINDSVGDMAEDLDFEFLETDSVHSIIKKLNKGENHEWSTPEGTPVWVKWKVFYK